MEATQPIVTKLFDRYFDGHISVGQTPYVSSHWDEESSYLEAVRSEDGEVRPTSVQYWGCTLDGLKAKVADKIHRYSHFPHLENRFRIIKFMRTAKSVCDRMGLETTHTVFRQVCSVELISRYLHTSGDTHPLRIIVIGDGIGVLSALFKEIIPDCSITMVDLGKTLLYQAYHCGLAHPNKRHSLVGDGSILTESDFVYCPTEDLDALRKHDFDVAVNIASMGEMNFDTVARYFDFLRNGLKKQNLFYCCNRETKIMPGGEISEFLSYPWDSADQILVDSECPWHRYTVGRTDAKIGPRIFGRSIPLLGYYDGRIRHRLARLSVVNEQN